MTASGFRKTGLKVGKMPGKKAGSRQKSYRFIAFLRGSEKLEEVVDGIRFYIV